MGKVKGVLNGGSECVTNFKWGKRSFKIMGLTDEKVTAQKPGARHPGKCEAFIRDLENDEVFTLSF